MTTRNACEHVFLLPNSTRCIKCGWTATPDRRTISLLTESLYTARADVNAQKETIEVLSRRLLEAKVELASRREPTVDKERVDAILEVRHQPFRIIIERYLKQHCEKAFAIVCKCDICLDARKLLK